MERGGNFFLSEQGRERRIEFRRTRNHEPVVQYPIPLHDVDLSERIGGLFFSNNAIELAARIQWEPILHALLFFSSFSTLFHN